MKDPSVFFSRVVSVGQNDCCSAPPIHYYYLWLDIRLLLWSESCIDAERRWWFGWIFPAAADRKWWFCYTKHCHEYSERAFAAASSKLNSWYCSVKRTEGSLWHRWQSGFSGNIKSNWWTEWPKPWSVQSFSKLLVLLVSFFVEKLECKIIFHQNFFSFVRSQRQWCVPPWMEIMRTKHDGTHSTHGPSCTWWPLWIT